VTASVVSVLHEDRVAGSQPVVISPAEDCLPEPNIV
jgi:hypothetical protein